MPASALTALIQSSSATTGIVITMASTGLIDLPTAIAIVLGANIGTCVTAVLAAIGKGREALCTAIIHVLVNTLGALLWIVLLPLLTYLVELISGNTSTSASAREVANAHTIFNVVNVVLFLILLTPLVALTRRLIPAAHVAEAEPIATYLDPDAVTTATLGLAGARRELQKLARDVRDFLGASFIAVMGPLPRSDEDIEGEKRSLLDRQRMIVGYLSEVSHSTRDTAQATELMNLLSATDELGHMTDYVASGVRRVARRRERAHTAIPHSPQLGELNRLVGEALIAAYAGTNAADISAPLSTVHDEVEQELRHRLMSRSDVDTYVVEADLLALLTRVRNSITRVNERFTDDPAL